MKRFAVLLPVAAIPLFLATSCASMKYGAMEKVGIHKRDLMVDYVKDGVDAQLAAKKTFQTTLEAFGAVVKIQAKDLEKTYNRLNSSYKQSQKSADAVRGRISAIESVSEALFKEWKGELKQYESKELRNASEAKLRQAQASYKLMHAAMQAASAKMDPVLRVFGDHVLFLKHNLNAAAISSIQGEVVAIESSVNDLVASMERSISEAQTFLAQLQPAGAR